MAAWQLCMPLSCFGTWAPPDLIDVHTLNNNYPRHFLSRVGMEVKYVDVTHNPDLFLARSRQPLPFVHSDDENFISPR